MGGLLRAGALGLSMWLAVIMGDSMQLQGQIAADAALILQDRPGCLAIGPQGLPPGTGLPLMGLTAPKPIILLIADPRGPQFLRWSFRWHGFVRGAIAVAEVHCIPAMP